VGIVPQLSFIVGIPTTEVEELENEISFLQSHPVDFSPFVLLDGSPMCRRPEELGLRIEDRELLFETPDGAVYAPRFRFTVERGLSPLVAERRVREALASGHPKRRPHLGEVHATVLADGGFFDEESRPEAPPPPAAQALVRLRDRQFDHRWALHVSACLEALGDLGAALVLVEGRMTAAAGAPTDARLLLHMVALLNEMRRPDLVRGLIGRDALNDDRVRPALQAELLRTESAVGRPERVLELAEEARRGGVVVPWLHPAVARAHEELGDPEAALAAHREAEIRDWYDPAHTDGQARCLAALGRDQEARRLEAKAERKEALLPVDWP
jgi:hypothetical protein